MAGPPVMSPPPVMVGTIMVTAAEKEIAMEMDVKETLNNLEEVE